MVTKTFTNQGKRKKQKTSKKYGNGYFNKYLITIQNEVKYLHTKENLGELKVLYGMTSMPKYITKSTYENLSLKMGT